MAPRRFRRRAAGQTCQRDALTIRTHHAAGTKADKSPAMPAPPPATGLPYLFSSSCFSFRLER
jgi:hypothetical protein